MSVRTLVLIIAVMLSASAARAGQINDQLTLTVTERFRFVSWDNTVTLNEFAGDERAFTRHRTTIGSTWQPRPRMELGVTFANEFRYYIVPQTIETNTHEVFFDQLYVRFKKIHGYPLTLTIGRQNIVLGEGFVMMDGGPLDGSRSIYFNALRADWDFRSDRTVTLFAVSQKETDKMLPILDDKDQPMVEQPEQALGIYYQAPTFHLYYIYKHADSNSVLPRSRIHTLGGRVSVPVTSELQFTAEAAKQLGVRGRMDRSALGGYAYLQYNPLIAQERPYLPVALTGGVVYLSGGEDGAREWNDWDPLFSRWPKWSESFIYTQIQEDRVAYWTNLTSIYGKIEWLPDQNTRVQGTLQRLASAKSPGRGLAFPGGWGRPRGTLFIGKISYQVSRYLSGHLVWERFWPGEFYAEWADPYSWLRSELLFKW